MMENGKLKVWLPCIRAGSGTDVFTLRLAAALEKKGFATQTSWFPLRYEAMPHLLRGVPAPAGTDIVFTNSWNGFAFKRAAIPLVTTLHHAEFGKSRPELGPLQALYRRLLIRRYETYSFDSADCITAVSNYAAASIVDPGHARKTRVIHNWIDLARFSPPETRQGEHRPFRLLFVGKPTHLKGADLLPEIMRRLGGDFHLYLAGAAAQWGKRPLHANMTRLGQLTEQEMVRQYRLCDALLFPSYTEGFGYTALEAMACGVPVIASNATALPELVDHGVTGLLCETGNIASFADACRHLRANPPLCDAMGRAGRAKAVARFSEDGAMASYADLIQTLLS